MSFYEKYLELCAKAGKSPSCVALEISLSKTTVNRWKNGGGVTDATALKVANYFGVSHEWLKGETDDPSAGIKKEPAPKRSELSLGQLELIELSSKMSDDELRKFIAAMKAMLGESM